MWIIHARVFCVFTINLSGVTIMGSISNAIAVDVINGKYNDDKPVKVVSYLNAWDGVTVAVVFAHDNYNKYEQSPACQDVQVIWNGKLLTEYGVGYFMEEIKAGKISLDSVPDTMIARFKFKGN